MPEADRSVRTSSSRTSSGASPSSTPHRSAAARSAWTWHTSLRVSSSPGAPRCRAASPRGGHRAGSRRVCSAWGSSRCSNPRWFSPVSGVDGAWGCMVGPAASRGGGSEGGRFRTQASRVCPAQPRAAGRMTAGTTPTEVVVNRRRAELQIRVGDQSSWWDPGERFFPRSGQQRTVPASAVRHAVVADERRQRRRREVELPRPGWRRSKSAATKPVDLRRRAFGSKSSGAVHSLCTPRAIGRRDRSRTAGSRGGANS